MSSIFNTSTLKIGKGKQTEINFDLPSQFHETFAKKNKEIQEYLIK